MDERFDSFCGHAHYFRNRNVVDITGIMTNTITKLEETGGKKKILPCTMKKRNMIIASYRENKGSIIDISRTTGISISRIYQIFEDFPEVRQEIDQVDTVEAEDLKQFAIKKLRANIGDGLQRAIEYTLDKEPRKARGKIVVNKETEFGGGNVQVNLIFKEVDKRDVTPLSRPC